MREAKNYLSKINSIDFGPSVDPNAILKYLFLLNSLYAKTISFNIYEYIYFIYF